MRTAGNQRKAPNKGTAVLKGTKYELYTADYRGKIKTSTLRTVRQKSVEGVNYLFDSGRSDHIGKEKVNQI